MPRLALAHRGHGGGSVPAQAVAVSTAGGEGRLAGRPLEEQSLQGCIPARPLGLENAVTDGRIGPGGDKPFSQPSFCFSFISLPPPPKICQDLVGILSFCVFPWKSLSTPKGV